MFMSVFIGYHLFHKRSKFLQNSRYEIVCTSTVGANIAKYRNYLVSPLPKQNLLLYLHVHKIPQVRCIWANFLKA